MVEAIGFGFISSPPTRYALRYHSQDMREHPSQLRDDTASDCHGSATPRFQGGVPLARIQPSKFAVFAMLVLTFLVILQNAWVSDDAYIGFRTIDNLQHGYGLTWNVGERVQVFTNPLCMMVTAVATLICPQFFYAAIIVGLLVSLATLLIFASKVSTSHASALVGLFVLLSSKGFVDFSTSGLENPLTHLLLALFIWQYLKGDEQNLRRYYLLCIICGLGAFNRLDTVLIYAPMLIYAARRFPKLKAIRGIAVGFIPLLVWEIFSVAYFGFPFPNTAYAKLGAGIGTLSMAHQGLIYLADARTRDPVLFLVIPFGIALPCILRDRRTIAISIGITLYLLYIARIGGDFMACRFLTAPLVCAVCVIGSKFESLRRDIQWATFCCIAAAALTTGGLPILTTRASAVSEGIGDNGIADERLFYFSGAGLLNEVFAKDPPEFSSASLGRSLRDSGFRGVQIAMMMGFEPFFAGPRVLFLDQLGMTDPLLARLPDVHRDGSWRVGHYLRQFPEGYAETRRDDRNEIADPSLAEYEDKLRIITCGPVFTADRFLTILKFNFGAYDHLLKAYVDKPPASITLAELQQRLSVSHFQPVSLTDQGLDIWIGSVRHFDQVQLAVSTRHAFAILFYSGNSCIENQMTPVEDGKPFVELKFQPSQDTIAQGYDRIRVVPLIGSRDQAIAGIVLTGE